MIAYFAAVAAAVSYGVATVLQAVGVRRTTVLRPGVALGARVAAQAPYVAGLGLDLVGFLLAVVALQSLPLFLVQSLLAASVGVTAVVAVAFAGARLHRRETLALVTLVIGLVLLAVSARPGRAETLGRGAQWLVLALLPVLAVLAAAAGRSRARGAGVLVAAAAGIAFGVVGVAARGLLVPHPWWRAVALPVVWAIVGFGVLGVASFTVALQRAKVTVAAAVMSATETVLPAAAGLVWLHDRTRPGAGHVAAAGGFALALLGVLGLTGYAELEP